MMTRFRFLLPFAASLFLLVSAGFASPALAVAGAIADDAKDAKKEIAFGIDVARRGLWQEARFRFELAAARDPDSASAFNNLGVTLEQQGVFDQARAAYERALELKPKSLSIQQNYDLFREADEKRNRKKKKDASPKATPTPEPPKPVGPEPETRR